MRTLTALDLRKKLGSVLNSVSGKLGPLTITRANKPLAVIMSIEDYREKVLKSERQQELQKISLKMDARRRAYQRDDLVFDVVQAIREIRDRK